MANNPIYPVAYTIKHNQARKLHYLGFPEKWKNELLTIEQKKNPRFKSEYGLPTIALKKMVDSWMEGIVDFRTLKATSEDTQWLISTVPFKGVPPLITILSIKTVLSEFWNLSL